MAGTQRDSAFLNIPYDSAYEQHFLAYVAGVASFGLDPRATLELTSGERRLDRLFQLISGCRYSFHDLSLVELDHTPAVDAALQHAVRTGRSSRLAKCCAH